MTLRKSTNPNTPSAQAPAHADQPASDSSSASYFNTPAADTQDLRYSKDSLLDIYKANQSSVGPNGDVARLYVNSWNPEQPATSTSRGWGKINDTRDNQHGPEVCWDQSGEVQPVGLEDMSEAEKLVGGPTPYALADFSLTVFLDLR